jgi:hypothetical protein
MECLHGLFRDDERKDGFEEIYGRVKAAIEAYALMEEREGRRLKPSRN